MTDKQADMNTRSGEAAKGEAVWLAIGHGEGGAQTRFVRDHAEMVDWLWEQCGPNHTGKEDDTKNEWFSYLEDGDNWRSLDDVPQWWCKIEVGETGCVEFIHILESAACITLAAERDRLEAERDAAYRLHDGALELYRRAVATNTALREAITKAISPLQRIEYDTVKMGPAVCAEVCADLRRALSHPSAPSPVVPACRAEAVCETCRNHPNGVMRPVEGVIRPVPCPDCTPSAKEKM